MAELLELPAPGPEARDPARAGDPARAVRALEDDGMVVLRDLAFPLSPAEAALADPAVLAKGSKNVSLDPATDRLTGHVLEGERLATLHAMARRYGAFADDLLARLLPDYARAAQKRRTSFRPGAIDTRALSPRKDDKRLHVDAFPSSPVQGRRILRVFSNVDPAGSQRLWRVGTGGFDGLAGAFAPRLRGRAGVVRGLLAKVGVTRGVRSPYDQAMLELHDLAKLDDAWQAAVPHVEVALPAGSTWVVFTDGTPHAAMSGRNAFEQTYLLPVEAMRDPAASPLRRLERITGRAMA